MKDYVEVTSLCGSPGRPAFSGGECQSPGGSNAPADTSREVNGSGQGATGTVSPGVQANPSGTGGKSTQSGSASRKMPRVASDGRADVTKNAY